MSALIRVGHRGAAAVAPANTLVSFDAALAIGIDMVEFDVLAEHRDGSGELFVAHDRGVLDTTRSPTLHAALAHMSTPDWRRVRLQIDIKQDGLERRILDTLDAVGARERAFATTGRRRVLRRLRELAPELRIGWTVPEIPAVSGTPVISPTIGRAYRRLLPARAARRIAAGAVDALVPHWRIVDAALVEAVRGAGGELYAWTVDDAAQIARLQALGVTGIITNDPRLFHGSTQVAEL